MTRDDRGRERRPRRAPPSGFFYDRLIPALLILMGIALLAVVVLSLVAWLGWLPSP